jgi:hypothetical protein
MSRCKHCGEYLAIAEEIKLKDGIGYQPISMDDSDMFDLDYVAEENRTLYVFGTTNSNVPRYDNNIPYIVKGNRLLNIQQAILLQKAGRLLQMLIANAHTAAQS